VTVTPGITPPLASVTRPFSDPVVAPMDCAAAAPALNTIIVASASTRLSTLSLTIYVPRIIRTNRKCSVRGRQQEVHHRCPITIDVVSDENTNDFGCFARFAAFSVSDNNVGWPHDTDNVVWIERAHHCCRTPTSRKRASIGQKCRERDRVVQKCRGRRSDDQRRYRRPRSNARTEKLEM
jgi:hypothetical protein